MRETGNSSNSVQKQWDPLSHYFVSWYSAQHQWDSLSHYFIIWHSASAMRTSVSLFHIMTQCSSNEILCLIISYYDTVQQQWNPLFHDFIWWKCVQAMTAWMCPIISHYDTVLQEWDSLSDDLIWWQNAGEWDFLLHDLKSRHNVTAMGTCLMIWYDTTQQPWDPLPHVSYDESAAAITPCVPHDLKWRQCTKNYTLCSP
jgi:hypothetical protein